jgi:hypothetical protein
MVDQHAETAKSHSARDILTKPWLWEHMKTFQRSLHAEDLSEIQEPIVRDFTDISAHQPLRISLERHLVAESLHPLVNKNTPDEARLSYQMGNIVI